MPRLSAIACALLLAGLASGCGRDSDVPPRAAAVPGAGDGQAEWRGHLPCADCEAIDTRLVLEHHDGERLYELVEVYVAVDGSASFEESGRWHLDDALLSLEPDTGGLRRFALVQGGALQVRDPRGRPFPGREHDLLLPFGHRP